MRQGDYDYLMPGQHRRGVLRWLLLAIHVIPFAVLIFAYPRLAESYQHIFTGNLPWLAIIAWAGALLLHLGIVCLLELIEAIRFARREREQRRAYERYQSQQKRDRMAGRI